MNLHPCSSIFIYSPPPSLEIWREWEGKEIIVLSVLVANCTFWVRQYSWSWKHSYSCVTRCKTSPMLCFAANKPHWGNSQTEKKLQDCLLLDLSYRGCVLSSQQLFFFFFRKRKAYLWTIIWHHVHIPPTRWTLVICCVCSPPFYVTQWAAFFLCSFPPSINTQIYRLCQPQSPFSWWGPLAVGEKATTW